MIKNTKFFLFFAAEPFIAPIDLEFEQKVGFHVIRSSVWNLEPIYFVVFEKFEEIYRNNRHFLKLLVGIGLWKYKFSIAKRNDRESTKPIEIKFIRAI